MHKINACVEMIDSNFERLCHWGPSQFDECWNMELAYLKDTDKEI